jgi:uncharacterized protein YodC (DUF2158 family)
MSVKRAVSPASELTMISPAESFHDAREPPLVIGNRVRLNSGGPIMLVVDINDDAVIVAWRDSGGSREHNFPALCVHRVCD